MQNYDRDVCKSELRNELGAGAELGVLPELIIDYKIRTLPVLDESVTKNELENSFVCKRRDVYRLLKLFDIYWAQIRKGHLISD